MSPILAINRLDKDDLISIDNKCYSNISIDESQIPPYD